MWVNEMSRKYWEIRKVFKYETPTCHYKTRAKAERTVRVCSFLVPCWTGRMEGVYIHGGWNESLCRIFNGILERKSEFMSLLMSQPTRLLHSPICTLKLQKSKQTAAPRPQIIAWVGKDKSIPYKKRRKWKIIHLYHIRARKFCIFWISKVKKSHDRYANILKQNVLNGKKGRKEGRMKGRKKRCSRHNKMDSVWKKTQTKKKKQISH